LDEIMEANKKFITENNFTPCSHHPERALAIVTCMDTRLVDFLERALGIGRCDVKMIKNAGNTVIDENSDVIKSLAAATCLLGCKEVMVVGHTNCGMAGCTDENIRNAMIAAGIEARDLEGIDLKKWIGGFDNEEQNVRSSVENIRGSKFIPKNVPIHGLIIDINTGELKHLLTLN
jgi:carbonic anhydrase